MAPTFLKHIIIVLVHARCKCEAELMMTGTDKGDPALVEVCDIHSR